MRPSSPCDAGAIVAFAVFQHARHPGRVEVSGPQSHGPHVRMPPHRKPCLPRPAPGLLPAQAGSPLAGQVSHLLDDKQSFMEASHPPIPFDQPCLVALKLLSEGMGIRAVSRSKGVTTDAISAWVRKAADHINELTVCLERDMHLTQCQIDEFWSYILKKKRI